MCSRSLSSACSRCPFTVCRRRVPRECCTARLAGRQPSIKLMYELQTRDVCPMGPVYPLFLHQPTPFRAAPFFFSSKGQPLSFPSRSLHPMFRTFLDLVPISPLDGSWMLLNMKDKRGCKGVVGSPRILFLRERLIKIPFAKGST